jgi:hypothetical protein
VVHGDLFGASIHVDADGRPVSLLDRAAYAVVTCTLFGDDESDEHFAWCVRQLTAPDTCAALWLPGG